MQITLNSLNITLTAGDIIKAILNSNEAEIAEIKALILKLTEKTPKPTPTKESKELKFGVKKCLYCKIKFNPNSGSQVFCCNDHKRKFKKEHGKRRKHSHLPKSKKVATLPVNNPVMIEKEPPIVPARRSHSDYISLAEGIN